MFIKFGRFVFRYRNFLGPAVFLTALALSEPQYPFARPELKIVFDLVGVLLVVLGESLRIVTVAYEYIVRGGRNRQVYASKLIQGGMFGHARNPLYLANILIAVGLALIVHAYAFYLIVVPAVVLAYLSIVAAEEQYLVATFGNEYRDYCKRVPRWWPRLTGFRSSIEGHRFEWKRVLVKEYNTMFVLPATVVGLYAWTEYSLRGMNGVPSQGVLAATALVWGGLYLSVRALKKSGQIAG